MLSNFDEALKRTEQTKSEIIRECMRKFIEKSSKNK